MWYFIGYGGGYNDRGVVEYKEHRDSDDEYDEFGRRKRKIDERSTHREDSSSSSRNESSRNESSRRFVKTIIPGNFSHTWQVNTLLKFEFWIDSKRPKSDKKEDSESEEDTEDDEDDSNSGDLSKYQLFDSESDTEKSSSGPKKKSGETKKFRSRRTRSRSRSKYVNKRKPCIIDENKGGEREAFSMKHNKKSCYSKPQLKLSLWQTHEFNMQFSVFFGQMVSECQWSSTTGFEQRKTQKTTFKLHVSI